MHIHILFTKHSYINSYVVFEKYTHQTFPPDSQLPLPHFFESLRKWNLDIRVHVWIIPDTIVNYFNSHWMVLTPICPPTHTHASLFTAYAFIYSECPPPVEELNSTVGFSDYLLGILLEVTYTNSIKNKWNREWLHSTYSHPWKKANSTVGFSVYLSPRTLCFKLEAIYTDSIKD